LTRLPSAICALVITLVCALSVSVAKGQAVVVSVQSFGSGGNSGTTYAIAKPTGLAVGDLMVMSAAIEGGKTFAAPSATGTWTEVIRTANGSNLFIVVLRKIAVQADVDAANFSVGVGGGKYSIGLSRITGHHPTTPIAASAGATGSGTAVAAPAITTTAANQLVLSFHGVKKSATFTASASFGTEIYDVAADPPSHAAYRYVQAGAGSTGTKTATSSLSEQWVGIQVAIASAPAAKTNPTITTAPTASAITFGQTLASSTLSGGSASTAGTFAFTTPTTAPGVGTASQNVTFTPTNTASFNTITTTVNVTVNKATPSITAAPTASAITFGQTLANSTLSGGSASTPGTFAFTTSATAPNAGTASQGVTFTPTDSVNYNTATGTVSVTVAPRPLTITAAAASKASGATDPTLTYSSSGLLAGDSITGSLARSSGETTGSYPITQGTLSAGSNYTISFTGANFVITGLKAMPDSIQKPSDGSALKIPVASLLANDGTLNANGEIVAASNLTITGAQTSLGAALVLRGQFILFLPTTNGQETLTYTVGNGTATSTATVTLTGEASAPPFSLEVIKRGTAAFSGGSTSVTHDFLGVPNQTYRIQYTTNLSTWTTAPDQSSGATGSFSVTFTQSGDLAAAWNSQMFFRATKP